MLLITLYHYYLILSHGKVYYNALQVRLKASLDFASANATVKTMQGQTSEPVDSGGRAVSAHYLMSRFLTQPYNPIDSHPSSHASGVRKMPRNEIMSNASLKWSMAHLCPWWEWGAWHPCSTRDWLLSCQRRDERPIYSSTLGWIQPTSVFSLLRSVIMCIRGAQSSIRHDVKGCDSFNLITAEAHIHKSQ